MSIEKLLKGVWGSSIQRIRIAPRLVEMPIRAGKIPDTPKPTQLLNFLERKSIKGNVISRDTFEKNVNDILTHTPIRPH